MFEPMGDRVLVQPVEQNMVTAAGIILPEQAKERPQEGEVLAVGTAYEMKQSLNVGDIILYAKFGGTEVEIDDKEYVILRQNDILGRIKNANG